MKNLVLTTIVIIAIFNNSKAQENETDFREKLTFGIKAGLNFSNVYDSKGDDFNADPKFGLATGICVAIPIGKYIGIQPEALLSQKGFQATGKVLGNPYKFTRTTTYLDFPLLLLFKPSEFISILVGPQYSYLLKQSDVYTNAGTSTGQQTEFVNDNIRKNTLCFTGGIDINIKHIVLGARAGWDVQSNNGDGSSVNPRYKNVWYQGTIGFRLYKK